MVAPEEAWRIVLKHVRPLRRAATPLREAAGLCLAEDVRADRDQPPADRSAMDGYAVRSADLRRAPCSLRLVGEVAAGSAARPRVAPGTCVRILTGANVPPGADAVVMVEQTREERGGVAIFLAGRSRRQHLQARRGRAQGRSSPAQGHAFSARRRSASAPPSARRGSRSFRGRASPSSAPARNCAKPARRCARMKCATPTARPSARRSRSPATSAPLTGARRTTRSASPPSFGGSRRGATS